MARRSKIEFWPARLVWGAAALLAMTALATASAWELYESPRLPVVATAGLAIGTGSVLLGAWLGWRWWAIGLTAFGAYALAVVPTSVPTAMTSPARIANGMADGVAGLVLGWKQLLTITLPAGEYQAILVPFFATVTACSLAAFALMVFSRSRSSWAVVPMMLMVAFGAVFGSSAASAPITVGPWTADNGRHVTIAVLAVAVCVVWLVGNARLERARAMRAAQSRTGTARLGSTSAGLTLRRQALAAALVVIAAVGALMAAPVAQAFGPRQVPRESVDPLLLLRQQASPLSTYRAWFAEGAYDAPLFTVENAGDTDRVRIATLAEYDGETFHVGAEDRFSRQPQTQAHDMTMTIGDGYRGVWVPLASAEGGAPTFTGPRAEQLADAYYANTDANSAVVVIGGDAPGQGLRAGDQYVTAAARSLGPEALYGAQGEESRIVAEDYPQLAAWVEQQGLGRSGSDLVELIDRLRERGYLSHATRESAATALWTSRLESRSDYVFQGNRAGHSAARVDELFESMLKQERRAGELATPAALVAAVGDDEQFATAAALLAAYLGFDSRVVLGVRLGATGSDLGVEPCASTCTGANVAAWTEVRAANGEWATLDSTPQFELTPLQIQEGQTPPENPTEPEQVTSDVVEPPAVANDASGATTDPVTTEQSWLDEFLPAIITIALVSVGTALLLVPLLLFPIAKRSRRRWRRRTPLPEVAMVGAWHELVDSYVDYGIEVPTGLTRAETADVLARPAAARIAAAVDDAVFAEQGATHDEREAAWLLLDEERRAIAAAVPWTRRARAVFSPASLRRAARGAPRNSLPSLLRKDRRAQL